MTVTTSEHPMPADEWVGLPAAGEFLGLHRATVNEMVRQRRIPARREGAHWLIRRDDLLAFKQNYRRPRNAPRRHIRRDSLPETAADVAVRLADWGDATVPELAEVLNVHHGNIRKNLSILQTRALAEPTPSGSWRLTPAGYRRVALAGVCG
jgi:excisionase family DNA binding protein